MAVQIDACNAQFGTKYQYLTPCNLYGKYDNFENYKKAHFVTALIKKISDAKINDEKCIYLFGTGTPLRQFMYAGDFAKVIYDCIYRDISDSFNVVTTENLSIKEIAEKALVVCGAEDLEIKFDTSKPDGQFRKDASNKRMMSIFPDFNFTSLDDGIRESYEYLRKKSDSK